MTRDELEKEHRKAEREHLEFQFLNQIRVLRLPDPVREYQFCETRKYRADFAWPELKILVEIQGGTRSTKRTGHSTHEGIRRDCEKSNLAQRLGFTVFKFTGDMVKRGEAIQFMEEILKCSE